MGNQTIERRSARQYQRWPALLGAIGERGWDHDQIKGLIRVTAGRFVVLGIPLV